MNIEITDSLRRRAALHGALSDPVRLAIVEALTLGDAAPSELQHALGVPSNLLAHHAKTLENAGLIRRARSEADRRRSYLQLRPDALSVLTRGSLSSAHRIVFVCTAASARSHLAASLWRRASRVPASAAGTHPASRIDPGTFAAASRHDLPMRRVRPAHIDDVLADGDLIVTVCDSAHEELDALPDLHWSIPDPVPVGTATAFDAAVAALSERVTTLASHVQAC